MVHDGEKWDKTGSEVGKMRLYGLAVKTAPDSVVTGPETAQQVQTGPGRSVPA